MNAPATLGKKIRATRRRKAWSQEMLAHKAHRKTLTLRDIETGKRFPRFQTIQKIARALDLTPEELASLPSSSDELAPTDCGAELSTARKRHQFCEDDRPSRSTGLDEHVPGIRSALLRFDAMACGLEDADQAGKPPTLIEVRYGVDAACRLRQASRYVELGAALPVALIASQQAARALRDEKQRTAFGLLAEANHVAAAFLKKAGRHELAWVAVDRGVLAAEQADSRLLRAASAYRLANLLLEVGQLDEAAEIAAQSIDLLEAGVDTGSPPYRSMWGALWLKRAVIAARQRDTATTWECIGEARAMARWLGVDRNDFWTAFGPANVAIHEVSVAVELGDWGGALRRAQAVSLHRLPAGLFERRACFHVDVARCFAVQRQDDRALQALLEAERMAPEDARHSRHAQALVGALLTRERKGALPGLRALAARSGVHA